MAIDQRCLLEHAHYSRIERDRVGILWSMGASRDSTHRHASQGDASESWKATA